MKPIGYIVMESCEDYEQALVLRTGAALPPGGILDWSDRRPQEARAMFGTREEARAAINRTEHYRLAFGLTNLPEKKFCSVAPVSLAAAQPKEGSGV